MRPAYCPGERAGETLVLARVSASRSAIGVSLAFVPKRGHILICDFDMARVPPEMPKTRRVAVVSPKSYNMRHGLGPGRCIVVPFSASPPKLFRPSHIPFAAGAYASLTVPTWAICEAVASLSHARLDRVASGKRFLSEKLSDTDLERIETGLKHALGMP